MLFVGFTVLALHGCGSLRGVDTTSGTIEETGTDSSETDETGVDSASPGPESPEPFTVVVLPDTQNYSRSYPSIFAAQTAWIADQRDTRDIAFVLHEGDITDTNSAAEWEVASGAMAALDGLVECAVAVGNHDLGDHGSANVRDSSGFNTAFPIADFRGRPSGQRTTTASG